MKKLLALILGLALAAGVAGHAQAQTIRIGGIGPLSAPGAVVGGIAMQWTMNLAVKDINEKGCSLRRNGVCAPEGKKG